MKFDLFLNDLENRLTVFKTESEVDRWLSKKYDAITIFNYKNAISLGNDYIKQNCKEKLKEIELDLMINNVNSQVSLSSEENLGEEVLAGGLSGLGIAAGICTFFPVAIIPTLIIGSILGVVGGNISLRKKVCKAILDNSEEFAKSIDEQIKKSLTQQQNGNSDSNDSYAEKSVKVIPSNEFGDIVFNDTHQTTKLSKDQLAIKSFLEKRKIKYLVHFTNSKNIDSIKQHGILSVQELTRRGIRFNNNDENRYDRMLNYISLSITQPNKYVLKKFKENGTLTEVSLIYIDAAILYEEISTPRLYCDRNAAKGSCQKGSSLSDFENMFSNNKEYDRYEHYRDDNEPTDTQAEILFNKKVDVKYIKRIVQL